jgi:hypothetical protein
MVLALAGDSTITRFLISGVFATDKGKSYSAESAIIQKISPVKGTTNGFSVYNQLKIPLDVIFGMVKRRKS